MRVVGALSQLSARASAGKKNLTCITVKNGRWFVIRVVEVVSIPVGRNIPQGIIFIEQKFGVGHLLASKLSWQGMQDE